MQHNTSHTITDPDRLLAEIDKVRQQGWADALLAAAAQISGLLGYTERQ